ncbi:hypothetical protein WA556_000736 [Blastocystis sp. ATCC 50177/Nand II]
MSSSLSSENIRDLLSKISKLEESYRMKQMELSTEVEKHKKTQSELDGLRKEVSILVEEKMKLCEKIGTLTESCSQKDHSSELLKKDMDKRMSELRVLERRLDEERENYRQKRETFKQQIDEVNGKLHKVLDSYDEPSLQKTIDQLQEENARLKKQCGESDASSSDVVMKHEVYARLQEEKQKQEALAESLQSQLAELSEYANKLEAEYNKSMEYISHLEAIMSKCSQCTKEREQLLGRE